MVVDERLVQRVADDLGHAADDLAFDQHGVGGLADVVGHQITLDRDRAGVIGDADHGDVNAVGIVHMRGFKQAVGRKAISSKTLSSKTLSSKTLSSKTWLAVAEKFRAGHERDADFSEANRRSGAPLDTNDPPAHDAHLAPRPLHHPHRAS